MENRGNRYIWPIIVAARNKTQLTEDMCDFITEIKRENGEEYPGQTLYDLVSSLNCYFQHENFDADLLSKTDKKV